MRISAMKKLAFALALSAALSATLSGCVSLGKKPPPSLLTLTPAATAVAPAAGQVQVVVTGRSLSVLPGVAGIGVSQSAAGPVEHFTTAGTP